jgi:hypothetical protein
VDVSELIELLRMFQKEHGDHPISVYNLDAAADEELFVIDVTPGIGKAMIRAGVFGD